MSEKYKYELTSAEIHRDIFGTHDATIVTMLLRDRSLRDTKGYLEDIRGIEGVLLLNADKYNVVGVQLRFSVTAEIAIESVDNPAAAEEKIGEIASQIGETLDASAGYGSKTVEITEHSPDGAFKALMPPQKASSLGANPSVNRDTSG